MKRPNEEATRAEFQRILSQNFPNAKISWEDVPQKREPPDWYVTLDDAQFAVEATTIYDFLTVTASTKMSAALVSAALQSFIKKDVEQQGRAAGILRGTYNVTLAPIPNLSEHRAELARRFLEYIEQTKNDEKADLYSLGYVQNSQITIQKIHCQKDSVMAGILMGVKWEGEAQEDLKDGLSKALADKNYKLRNVSAPKILLLEDNFIYSFMAEWASAISQCDDKTSFECILRIASPDKNQVLWAKSARWNLVVS
jgi:hypothetical protein